MGNLVCPLREEHSADRSIALFWEETEGHIPLLRNVMERHNLFFSDDTQAHSLLLGCDVASYSVLGYDAASHSFLGYAKASYFVLGYDVASQAFLLGYDIASHSALEYDAESYSVLQRDTVKTLRFA